MHQILDSLLILSLFLSRHPSGVHLPYPGRPISLLVVPASSYAVSLNIILMLFLPLTPRGVHCFPLQATILVTFVSVQCPKSFSTTILAVALHPEDSLMSASCLQLKFHPFCPFKQYKNSFLFFIKLTKNKNTNINQRLKFNLSRNHHQIDSFSYEIVRDLAQTNGQL
jgi:hypothetical protein